MSPQSALHVTLGSSHDGAEECHRVIMSTKAIAHIANLAFSGSSSETTTIEGRSDLASSASYESVVALNNPLEEETQVVGNDQDAAVRGGAGKARFTLRKRKSPSAASGCGGAAEPFLASYGSAFLSGIFADIAQAKNNNNNNPNNNGSQTQEEDVGQSQNHNINTTTDIVPDSPVPAPKKSRISLTKSLSRSAKSYRSLADADGTAGGTGSSRAVTRHDSLAFQLHLVGSTASSGADDAVVTDVGALAFPHLPATVSSSSCSSDNLTQSNAGQQTSVPETLSSERCSDDVHEDPSSSKESYGWFVAVDDDDDNRPIDAYARVRSSSSADLAFSAPTAPKAVDHDAEVEWAKAADTVDDVLGEVFF